MRTLLDDSSHLRSEGRAVFSTAQTGVFEDAVIVGNLKYVQGLRGEPPKMFDLSSDPGELYDIASRDPERARCLKNLLNNFRNTQLTYYSLPKDQRSRFFPPRLPNDCE